MAERKIPTPQEFEAQRSAVRASELVTPDVVRKFLSKSRSHITVEAIADHFDCAPARIREMLARLQDARATLHIAGDGGVLLADAIPQAAPTVIDTRKFKGREIAFGLTADNHLASRYARLDVLNALFDIWAGQGIENVYVCGNMIDGECRFNKFDLIVTGVKGQTNYFVEHWPARKGITTHFITGDDHEGWYVQREHVEIGQTLEDAALHAGRKDLHYLGHMEHDIAFRAKDGIATMRLIHTGGGSAYATSYAPQKIVESYQGGEKPTILLVGHYHKAEYGYPREVHVVQAGCTEDQTPFMRKKKIQAHVGGWTIRFMQSPDGLIHNFTVQWHAFYDRGFYEDAWKYHWTDQEKRRIA